MKASAGFSILEVTMVIGLLAAIGAFSLFVSIDTYRSYLFRGERDAIVQALQNARSRAMNNMCFGAGCVGGRSHGVHFDFDARTYTAFQGATFDPADSMNTTRVWNERLVVSGLSNVIFSQLSGDASPSGDITIQDEIGNTSVISINDQGRISWTR